MSRVPTERRGAYSTSARKQGPRSPGPVESCQTCNMCVTWSFRSALPTSGPSSCYTRNTRRTRDKGVLYYCEFGRVTEVYRGFGQVSHSFLYLMYIFIH
jgi:hypothetical protein